jgi:hypothetical protein
MVTWLLTGCGLATGFNGQSAIWKKETSLPHSVQLVTTLQNSLFHIRTTVRIHVFTIRCSVTASRLPSSDVHIPLDSWTVPVPLLQQPLTNTLTLSR